MMHLNLFLSLAGCPEGLVEVFNNVLRTLQPHAHLNPLLCTLHMHHCSIKWGLQTTGRCTITATKMSTKGCMASQVKALFLSSLPSARLSLQMATTSSMQLNATIFKSRREPTSPDVLVILTLIRLLVMP